jgi:CRISPR-associated exonuclease Cas4
MPYTEDELLPLSALQHLLFCERQFALIHVEQAWQENRLTAEGRLLHRKAHEGRPQTRDHQRVTRGLPLHSLQLCLTGQADVIEWQPPDDLPEPPGDLSMAERFRRADQTERRRWTVVPVEYKRGRPKSNDCDRVQLCAQALCLEEMLRIDVPRGQLFYGMNRRRVDVPFTHELRATTRSAAQRVHDIFASRTTPLAKREKKCDSCSLFSLCMPSALKVRRRASDFFERELALSLAEGLP